MVRVIKIKNPVMPDFFYVILMLGKYLPLIGFLCYNLFRNI